MNQVRINMDHLIEKLAMLDENGLQIVADWVMYGIRPGNQNNIRLFGKRYNTSETVFLLPYTLTYEQSLMYTVVISAIRSQTMVIHTPKGYVQQEPYPSVPTNPNLDNFESAAPILVFDISEIETIRGLWSKEIHNLVNIFGIGIGG